MSGYLLQLARHSLGISHRARSRATLPYATAAARAPMEEGIGQALEPALPQAATDGRTANAPEPRAQMAAPTPDLADAARTPPTLLPPQTPRAGPRQHAPLAKADTPGPLARDNSPAPESQRPHPASIDSTPAIDTPASEATRTPPSAFTQTDAPHPPQPDVQAAPTPLRARSSGQLDALIDRIVSPAASTAPASRDDAEVMGEDTVKGLPLPSRTAGSPARPGAAVERQRAHAQGRAPVDEADAAPDVHITIGRLEINPPPRPAPPPPQRRAPAPLSLADYLARRQGGGS